MQIIPHSVRSNLNCFSLLKNFIVQPRLVFVKLIYLPVCCKQFSESKAIKKEIVCLSTYTYTLGRMLLSHFKALSYFYPDTKPIQILGEFQTLNFDNKRSKSVAGFLVFPKMRTQDTHSLKESTEPRGRNIHISM